MAVSPNLKVNVSADTSKYSQAMKSAKAEMQDFSKVSGSAMDAFTSALGINMGKLKEVSGAAKALGGAFAEAGAKGSTAFKDMVPAIKGVGTALAGIGIGAAILAFKSLNQEAEYFRNTMEGATQAAALEAYIGAFKGTLMDRSTAGKGWQDFMDNFKRDWAETTGTMGAFFARVFSGQGLKGFSQDLKDARANAYQASNIAQRILETQRAINAAESQYSELNQQIIARKNIIKDKNASAADKARALAEAEEMIRQKYDGPNGLVALNQRLAQLYTTRNSITASSDQDIIEENAQRQKAANIAAAMQAELGGLLKLQNSVTASAGAEASSRAKAREEAAKLKALKDKFASEAISPVTASIDMPSTVTQQNTAGIIPFTPVVSDWVGFFDGVDEAIFKRFPNGMEIGVAFDYAEGLQDFTSAVESTLSSLAETTGSLIGQLVGDLATGGDAWTNFSNAALSAFGDMAVSIGKIAIQAGIASLGIQAAITSLGPAGAALAIAGGAALVALGMAVKTGLSNVAGGNYSASAVSAPSASSFTGGRNDDYLLREMNINVTGTLTGDGENLVAVINGQQRKNELTT